MFPRMNMTQFWSGLRADAKTDFATKLGRSRNYLAQIACGARKPSPLLAREIEEASGGQVTRAELLPDVFGPSRAA